MKITFRILLVLAICAMGYLCVDSIMTPIQFDKNKEKREKEIINNLIDIRTAQELYQKEFKHYCANTDSLIDFILNGDMTIVYHEGTLTDEQYKKGINTEDKALEIIKKGDKEEIAKYGLENFRRDTTFVNVYDSVFSKKYTRDNVAEMMLIPFTNGVKFTMDTATIINSVSGHEMPLFEASASYDAYLKDLDKQQLINLKDKQIKMGKFCGLKVGSLTESNNNSGNWE